MFVRANEVIAEHLNIIQQQIIESVVSMEIETVVDTFMNPSDALLALNAIITKELSDSQIENFKLSDAWESMKQIRRILLHPCPQNRNENYPYFDTPSDSNMVVYKDVQGCAAYEQRGLLGLTGRQNDTTPPATKEAIVLYIFKLVNQKIIQLSSNNSPLIHTLEELMTKSELDISAFIRANEIMNVSLVLPIPNPAPAVSASHQYVNPPLSSHAVSPHTLFSSASPVIAPLSMPSINLNFWQSSALEDFSSIGLTAQMLITNNGNTFDDGHYFALQKLIKYRHFTLTQALAEIERLSGAQASGIQEGLVRADVIPLNNFWHIVALEKLKSHGLTAQILSGLNDYGHRFDERHCYALQGLIIDRHFTLTQALAEIEGLSRYQAAGIEEGLVRADVILLNNFWHISALKQLKSQGLTAEILLELNDDGHTFDSDHCFALQKLVINRHFTLTQALAEIEGLSRYQAAGIEEGLVRADVILLNNFWHISALKQLKSQGLTAEILLELNDDGHTFDSDHCFALQKLVINRHFTLTQALAEIEGLSGNQAERIKNGETRDQVLSTPQRSFRLG